MRKHIGLISSIVLYGAIWGILEASLGAVLHLVPVPFLAGSIMFPIAATILLHAYTKLQSRQALLFIGLLAAAIKAINFLTPMNQWGVINPMIAIIIESLMVVGLVVYMTRDTLRVQVPAFIGASIAWRTLYLGWFGLQLIFTGFLASQIASLEAILSFAVLQGALSGLLALGLYRTMHLLDKQHAHRFKVRPGFASGMLAVALILSYIL